MTIKRAIPVLVCVLFLWACDYIVTPAPDVTPTSTASKGWAALVTKVGKSDSGDLHVDITIRNDTTSWSAMQAGKQATFTGGDGKIATCDTVIVTTGSNYLSPGFQMRGYTGGTKADPKAQPLYVECKGAAASPGSKLTIPYSYVTGDYNYYTAAVPVNAKLELNLDQVAAGLTYPIADKSQVTVEKPNAGIGAINNTTLMLAAVKRTDTGFEFSWEVKNPGEYPTYVHIGTPPVIGADGIIYGFYESPHLADTPIAPAGDKAEWTTDQTVPKDLKGAYILLSVESKKQKYFVSHVVDISDQ